MLAELAARSRFEIEQRKRENHLITESVASAMHELIEELSAISIEFNKVQEAEISLQSITAFLQKQYTQASTLALEMAGSLEAEKMRADFHELKHAAIKKKWIAFSHSRRRACRVSAAWKRWLLSIQCSSAWHSIEKMSERAHRCLNQVSFQYFMLSFHVVAR